MRGTYGLERMQVGGSSSGESLGPPVIVGTPVLADTIVQYTQPGALVGEILWDFPALSAEKIEQLVAFVKAHQYAAA